MEGVVDAIVLQRALRPDKKDRSAAISKGVEILIQFGIAGIVAAAQTALTMLLAA